MEMLAQCEMLSRAVDVQRRSRWDEEERYPNE